MQFAHASLLWLLLIIPPAMLGVYVWSERKRRHLIAQFVHTRLLAGLLAGVSERRRKIRLASLLLSVSLIIVALARPQWGFTLEEVKQRGLDIVVAIDTSKSMLAEDIQPNRLARAKLAALDLLQQAKSDRVGLVVFAGSAFLQCPLTIDDSVFRQSLDALDVNVISRGGTEISAAIDAAMGAFAETENYKVLVLFTDGEDHDSGALETARKAAQNGLQIFTIGVGTTEGELLRVQDASGKTDFIRDESGNVVKSRLNERILQELAGVSEKGFYLPLRGPSVIETLYAKGLAPLPKAEAGEKLVKRFHEKFHWPLSVALLLLAFEALYPERTRSRQKGETLKAPARQAAALVAVLLALPSGAHASANSALNDYRAGEYDKALSEYQELLKRNPSDARLQFNAGAAAYKEHEYGQAAEYFGKATAAEDLRLQQKAYYNRGNSTFQLGEAIPEQSKKQELWQRSLQDFESALKLNPNDPDAAHNREHVKRKLEELKQQQQQQQNQQNQQGQQDQQSKDQQQDQQQQGDQKQDQQQQQQDPQSQKQDSGEEPKQPPQTPPGQEGEDAQGQKPPGQEGQKDPSQPQAGEDQEKQEQPPEQESEIPVEGQMSPQQARQLLDAEKGDEKVLQFRERDNRSKPRPVRDW